MVMIGKDTYEDLTPERLEEIIDTFNAGNGASITPGPQIDRHFSPEKRPEGAAGRRDSGRGRKPRASRRTSAKTSVDGAVSVPPSEAGRPKSTDAETNPALKTPHTAPKAAASNVKAAEAQPISGTAAKRSRFLKQQHVRSKDRPGSKGRRGGSGPLSNPALTDKNRPAGIEKPAAPDDLKLISGVGPKIESTLNELGIFTYAQVAGWKKAERDWVDGYLNFKGRIERDDWVKQAKALAKGGEAEYIKVFGKKPR